MSRKRHWRDVLIYTQRRQNSRMILAAFNEYRRERGIPEARCDNPACRFHTAPLIWNEQPLPLTLDHIEGVNGDNQPGSLRLLCPNCDAQLPTRGGLNRGRVEKGKSNYWLKDLKTGTKGLVMVFGAAHYQVETGDITVTLHSPGAAPLPETRS